MFPTPVGMNRDFYDLRGVMARVPHTRGDEPEAFTAVWEVVRCSPHPWG